MRTEQPPNQPTPADRLAVAIVGVAVLIAAAVRLRLLGLPLERDEGEYAYMAQLLLEGVLPYTEAYSMKLPGIYGVYAAILFVFGHSVKAIHLALLLANALTGVALFLLGRRLLDAPTGAIAAAAFLVMGLSPAVLGLSANAEHFVLAFAVPGLLLTLRGVDENASAALLGGGLLLGCALLVKQHALPLVLFGGLHVALACREQLGRVGSFAACALAPLVATVLVYAAAGELAAFWFWTVEYASRYATIPTLAEGLATLRDKLLALWRPHVPIVLAALLGLSALVWHGAARRRRAYLGALAFASFLAVCPGLYFRRHYFVLLLPALALLAAVGARALAERIPAGRAQRLALVAVAALFLAYPLVAERRLLLRLSPTEATRETYGWNPFVEAVEVGAYLAENSPEGATIAVLGSEPQIYFYARRRAATGFLYVYPLMEPHEFARSMQQQMIDEIRSRRPDFVVAVLIPSSWLARADSERRLMRWAEEYVADGYRLCGVVDLAEPRPVYKWGSEARAYVPRSRYGIRIYEREEAA